MNKEEAERAVTRGTGFTSELPPPGSTSCPARCGLVNGWIEESGGGFYSFCIMSGQGVQSSQPENRVSRPC